MNRSALFAAMSAVLLLAGPGEPARAQPAAKAIVIEGDFADWAGIDPVFPAGASADGRIIEALWAASNAEHLWFRVRLASETILQRDSGLELFVDADGLAETGTPVDGLGAEIAWRFSEREGRARVLGLPIRISPATLGLRQAPTIAADEFELALDRRISVAGATIVLDSTVTVSFRVTGTGAGDSAAFTTGRIGLALSGTPPPPLPAITLARGDPSHLRVLSYNVLFDGLFDRPEPFRRILRALDPDILSLQEIYQHSADEAREWIEGVLPDSEWHAAKDAQAVILSRFPVRESGPIGADRRGAWARLETPDGPFVVINPHPPCCENDAGRQREFDALAAWIRDARASGRLDPSVPVVVAGDMNLVGEAKQLATLLRGEIADTATYGPAAAPDGDGTPLADARPYHLTGAEAYTWRGDGGPFAPGRLDYIVYTDSVLDLARAFVLWTPDLPAPVLDAAGLEAEDTATASDHLPVVADFVLRTASRR